MTHKEDKKNLFVRLRDKWNEQEARRKEKRRAMNEKFDAINEKFERKIRVMEKVRKHRTTFEPKKEEQRQRGRELVKGIKENWLFITCFFVGSACTIVFICDWTGIMHISLELRTALTVLGVMCTTVIIRHNVKKGKS